MRIRSFALLAAVAIALPTAVAAGPAADRDSAPTTAAQQGPRDDADSYEMYFPSQDGITTLHADVLRPAGLALDVPTPVILTVSPYTGHSGDTPTAYNPSAEGPSSRFYDFLDLSGALEQGYTYVMVDLPGTGGSQGCNDWGGPSEQGGVKSAVEWAASQPWSTGKVALLGKSYDGWTGLMGIAQAAQGLAAVVAMEPVYAGYNYLYNNGVKIGATATTIAAFQAGDARPGTRNDTPEYLINSIPQPWCYPVNVAMSVTDDPDNVLWAERNLLPMVVGSTVPLFLTQGFVERNTRQDAAFDFWNALDGEHNRAWFGQFDHDRGWDGPSEATPEAHAEAEAYDYKTGRLGFVAEVMRFLDEHLKGITPDVADPAIAVQDNFGRYRAEASWPPADAESFVTDLVAGDYLDDGNNSGAGSGAGNGIWTVSQELPHAVWMAGEPRVTFTADALPRSNFAANVYDIDLDGRATVVSRGTWLLRGNTESGSTTQTVTFDLYGQDWIFEEGHRIAVLASSANSDWWLHAPTNGTVTLSDFSIDLPLLTGDRTDYLDGEMSTRLEAWLGAETLTVPTDAFVNEVEFAIPGAISIGELFS